MVQTFGADVITTLHAKSNFSMAHINVEECDWSMWTPTLSSNAGDQKVCNIKDLSWLLGTDITIRPSGSLFARLQNDLKLNQWLSKKNNLSVFQFRTRGAKNVNKPCIFSVSWAIYFCQRDA